MATGRYVLEMSRAGRSPRAFANLAHRAAGDDEELRGLNSNVLRSTPSAHTVASPCPSATYTTSSSAKRMGYVEPPAGSGDTRVGDALHALELDEGAVAAQLRPRGDLQIADVLHVVPLWTGRSSDSTTGRREAAWPARPCLWWSFDRCNVCLLRHGSLLRACQACLGGLSLAERDSSSAGITHALLFSIRPAAPAAAAPRRRSPARRASARPCRRARPRSGGPHARCAEHGQRAGRRRPFHTRSGPTRSSSRSGRMSWARVPSGSPRGRRPRGHGSGDAGRPSVGAGRRGRHISLLSILG